MCLSPQLIPNPNYGVTPKVGHWSCLKDCTSQFIRVPCGVCPQCVAVKQMYQVQRVMLESLENHLFFASLSYNEESLPRVDTSTGFSIPYSDIRDLQCTFKRIDKYGLFPRPYKRFAVSERGSKYGRPHWHILFSVPKYPDDNWMDCLNLQDQMFDALLSQWCRNVGSTRKPIYQPLTTYVRRFIGGRLSTNYDLHYVVPSATDSGLASVAFYVLKYMLKPCEKEKRLQQAFRLNLPQEEYDRLWPVVRSGHYVSHGFGLNKSALSHVRSGVEFALREGFKYPVFINPDSGQTFPLSPYYKRRAPYFTFDDAMSFYMADSSNPFIDSVVDVQDPESLSQIIKLYSDYEKILSSHTLDCLDSLD